MVTGSVRKHFSVIKDQDSVGPGVWAVPELYVRVRPREGGHRLSCCATRTTRTFTPTRDVCFELKAGLGKTHAHKSGLPGFVRILTEMIIENGFWIMLDSVFFFNAHFLQLPSERETVMSSREMP